MKKLRHEKSITNLFLTRRGHAAVVVRQICNTDEQIIRILNEHEAGRKAAEFCREQSISEATFYRWKPTIHLATVFGFN